MANNVQSRPKKLSIVPLPKNGPLKPLEAQYNPKEISVNKSVPWTVHGDSKGDIPMLEFSSAQNRKISFDLFFDFYEQNKDVRETVQELTDMTLIDKNAKKDIDKHPPRVMIVFGMGDWIMGVIESLNIKYTMFNAEGIPVRATCSVGITETHEAQAS